MGITSKSSDFLYFHYKLDPQSCQEWGSGADAAIGLWSLSYCCKLKKSTCCVKILCTPDCPLSPVAVAVAVAVVPGSCDVGPHVDVVSNWDTIPHSDVASHDDVAQENLSGLPFMTNLQTLLIWLNRYKFKLIYY